MHQNNNKKQINFTGLSQAILPKAQYLIGQLGLQGKLVGNEFSAINPRRQDKHLGSFRINIKTGKWADFATSDKGGDLVSLYAYIKKIDQKAAAIELCQQYGINLYEHGDV